MSNIIICSDSRNQFDYFSQQENNRVNMSAIMPVLNLGKQCPLHFGFVKLYQTEP